MRIRSHNCAVPFFVNVSYTESGVLVYDRISFISSQHVMLARANIYNIYKKLRTTDYF